MTIPVPPTPLAYHAHAGEDILQFDGIPLNKLATQLQTPCYLYSLNHISKTYKEFYQAATDAGLPNPLVCYAVKANSHPSVIQALKNEGSGADTVSGGEIKRALESGVPPQNIVFSGVGKTREELVYASKENIYSINVESADEVYELVSVAKEQNKKIRIAFRLNPLVNAKTHKYISTGSGYHKFGLLEEDLKTLIADQTIWKHLTLAGVTIHIGSQLTDLAATFHAAEQMLIFAKALNHKLEFLDFGGGLGVPYQADQEVASLQDYMNGLSKVLKKHFPENQSMRVLFEPGRYLTAAAGIFLTQVLRTKVSGGRHFTIVDGGMNDFMRPSLYQAYHSIWPVRHEGEVIQSDVVGPVCETADTFGQERKLPQPKKNDYLVIAHAGAYGHTMSSSYNLREPVKEYILNSKGELI